MRATEEELINFFKQVALKNKALISKLKIEQCFEVDNEKWTFTLPKLHSFLQIHYETINSTDYSSFRKMIFNCPINQTVKLHGASISIFKNQKNVDKSLYMLEWIS